MQSLRALSALLIHLAALIPSKLKEKGEKKERAFLLDERNGIAGHP